MNPTCETCRWWDAIENTTKGECHRFPPTVVGYSDTQTNRDWIETECYTNTEFPVTANNDFCGEHSPRETSDAGGSDDAR